MHRRWVSIASLGALASLVAGASQAAMLQNTMPPDLILSEGSGPSSQLVARGPMDIISLPTAAADAVSAVPEPAGWAMMLVGFGGLGALLRRRRAAAA
jgi:hypothetical protein